jgi:hypothetical protein
LSQPRNALEGILKGFGWTVPEGYTPHNVARCRSCDKEILWCTTPAGKKAPINRDGTSHFADCPAADQWRQKPTRTRPGRSH